MAVTALKATILGAAVTLARKNGIHRLKRLDVACEAECGTGSINHHFGSMEGLLDAIVSYAVEHEIVEIIAQVRADFQLSKHPSVKRMSLALKERVAAYVIS